MRLKELSKDYILSVKESLSDRKIKKQRRKLIEELLGKRNSLLLSFEKTAEIVGMSPQKYIRLEYGDTEISVKEYKEAIEKIEKYQETA